ncbi:hypothetical protein BXZ70DRAFT_1012482 [Cristinia sonorae]|uniref:Uncharacterized protein n=1 Tax=Cristinia sonorae TaxID=1940300 RepID=A0A8K0UEF6_9AGAR|nr:hypothetical protein BXZ70DRAFT_1012482 [Cristinia sonorae]
MQTYQTELAREGLADGSPGGSVTATRLQSLLDRRAAWDAFQPTRRIDLRIDSTKTWAYSDNHLVWHGAEDDLTHVLQIPSKFRGIEEITWTIPDLPVNTELDSKDDVVETIAIDPGQDLVVVASTKLTDVEGASILDLYSRRLSNGENHPSSQTPAILFNWPLGHSEISPPDVQISGDTVAVSIRPEDDYYAKMLAVLNWRTGGVYVNIIGTSLSSAFIDDAHLLIGHDTPQSYVLSVVDLKAVAGITSDSPDILAANSLCQLRFPAKPANFADYKVSMSSSPPPFTTPGSGIVSQVPFHPGPERMISVDFDSDEGCRTALISSNTILDLVRRTNGTPREFAWEEWGPSGCALMPLAHVSAVKVHGNAAITVLPTQPGSNLSVVRFGAQQGGPLTAPIGANLPFASEDIQTLVPGDVRSWIVNSPLLAQSPVPGCEAHLGTDCVIIGTNSTTLSDPSTYLEIHCF